ncbi:hypothetical protein DYB30_012975 [Aphanomyces astaci]|uniref:PX domain-containing protein n=1 Tax=Aphanomyces astaci TaxID=112090 RepID=A0A397CGN7_APHAT|nr:hypothetical protein DYB30_012975 [Aphanomyces astaci]
MSVGLAVTGHLEADGKSVRFYVEMQSDAFRFSLNGRYSELRQLHTTLLHTLRALDKSLVLPSFPPKHVLEDMRRRTKIAQREAELFDYYTLVATNSIAVDWLGSPYAVRSNLASEDRVRDGVEFTPPQALKQRSSRRSRRSTNQPSLM